MQWKNIGSVTKVQDIKLIHFNFTVKVISIKAKSKPAR